MLQQYWRSSKKSYFLLVRRKENTYCCFLPPELIELGLSITWLRSHPPGRQIHKRNNYPFNEIMCFSFSESPSSLQCYRAVLGSVMSAYLSNCCLLFLLSCLCSGCWPGPEDAFSDAVGFSHSLRPLACSCLQIAWSSLFLFSISLLRVAVEIYSLVALGFSFKL